MASTSLLKKEQIKAVNILKKTKTRTENWLVKINCMFYKAMIDLLGHWGKKPSEEFSFRYKMKYVKLKQKIA